MQTISDTSYIRPSRGCVATIGFFDGVHRGHCCLIEQVRHEAGRRGLASCVVTFPTHPRQVMQSDFRPELLTCCAEKLQHLDRTGLDYCLLLEFTPQLAQLSARDFMQLLHDRYGVEVLLIGHDHRFGHDRSAGFDDYVAYGRELGMEVIRARAFHYDKEQCVSSSFIRRLLHRGDVLQAGRWLGYDYALQGTVVEGHRVGHTLGFPTANLRVECPEKLVPPDGTYAVFVHIGTATYGGMLGIGHRPTLDNGTDRSIEVNIFDFSGNLYGHSLRVSFHSRIRGVEKFGSVDELAERLRQDEAEARRILNGQ